MVKTVFERDLDKALQRLNRYISLNNRSEFELSLEALEVMRFTLENNDYREDELGMPVEQAKEYFVKTVDEFLDTRRGENCIEFSQYSREIKYRLLGLCNPIGEDVQI